MTWAPHSCSVCGQLCKAPAGTGAQAAKKWRTIRKTNRKILLTLLNHVKEGPLDVDTIRAYAAVEHRVKTTVNALRNRISELVAWRLIIGKEVLGSPGGKDTDYAYKRQGVAAYEANTWLASIVIGDDWKTDTLRNMGVLRPDWPDCD